MFFLVNPVSSFSLRKLFRRIGCALLLGCLGGGAVQAEETAQPPSVPWEVEATNHIGQWIWETNFFAKQTCRFWKSFYVPGGEPISHAVIHLTVDNGYTLFLDGHEIGRGSDWRTVTEYDVTELLTPGWHRIGVEAFNDRLEGGLIFGMFIQFLKREPIHIVSDNTWFLVSVDETRLWLKQKRDLPEWRHATVVGGMHAHPWENWPYGFARVAALHPEIIHFWQRGWFQLTLLTVCVVALTFCVWLAARLATQSKAQKLLQVERVRIARDIHDDLGAQLTQLLLLGEVARREQPDGSLAQGQFTQLCEQARQLAQALDEVVWVVNSRRDTIRDFANYVCKYAQLFLSATHIRCRLDVESELPATMFELPVRRNLFLAVKEALNNAAKYSQAEEVFLRIYRRDQKLSVSVEDTGRGFDSTQLTGEGNGLTNMAQRMHEIGGHCELSSQPGSGCLVIFTVPLPAAERRWFRRIEEAGGLPEAAETTGTR